MTNDIISAEVRPQVPALLRVPLSTFGFFIFIFFLFSVSFASAAELKRPPNNLGLVDYFPMDEGVGATTANKSRVGTSGTITGGTWVAGKKERALDFNANGSYMTYSCGANCVNYPYTVSLWFNADTLSGLLFGVNNGFNNSIAFTGGTYLHMSGNSNYMRGALTSNFQTGRWYNMTAVYTSSTNMKMYVDGVEQTVATDDWWTLQCANIYSIGSRNGGACASSLSFDGRIDDVRIYNRALPAADIANLYQLSFTKFNSSQNNKVTNGLVGLWSFDGADMSGVTAYDRSGQGNNGTLTNGPTRTIGKVGQGLNFDGVDDYVDIADSTAFTFGSDPMTVASWVNFGSGTLGSYQFIVSKNIDSFELNKSSTNALRIEMKCADDTPRRAQESVASLTEEGRWYHVAATFIPSTGAFDLYVDGVRRTTSYVDGQSPCPIKDSALSLAIGRRYNGAMMRGLIDEVRIYDRALTQNEITQLYGAGGTKINASQNNIPASTLQSGLVGLWSFNGPDMSGVTAYDRSGQGNNGTLTNGPTRTIGKVGQGLMFNGSNSYVDLGTSSTLKVGTGHYSVSFWYKGLKGSTESFFSFGPSCCTSFFDITNSSAALSDGPNGVTNVYTLPNDNGWHHVVVVLNRTPSPDTLEVYIDGVSDGADSSNLDGQNITSAGSTAIGLPAWASGSSVRQGSMDEVRIYNRTLSAIEVRQLYLLGR